MRPLDYIELKKFVEFYKDKIINKYLSKVYKYDEFYVFVIKSKEEKIYLYIKPGECIFIGDQLEFERDDETRKIEKIVKDKKILNFYIIRGNRVVVFELYNCKIYVEFFGGGNLIISNKEDIILFAIKYKDFGVRKIKKNEKYCLPPYKAIDPFEIDYNDFLELLKNSNRKDIVRFLILDLNIGPKYSEEILRRLKIEKNKKPSEVINISKELFEKIKEVLEENKFLLYEDDFSISKISNKKVVKEFEDFNSLLKNFYLEIRNEEKNKKILLEINKEIEKNKKIIEFIEKNIGLLKYIYDSLKDKKEIKQITEEISRFFSKDIKIERVGKYKYKILIKG